MINTEQLSSHIEPFIRSSIFMVEESTNTNVVYFIDRDFYFRKYDLKYFASGNITEVYHTQLNLDLVNQNCQDLVQLANNDSQLIMLCQRLQFKNKNEIGSIDAEMEEIQLAVLIELPKDHFQYPTIKYLEYDNSFPHNIDLLTGIKPYYQNSQHNFFLGNYQEKKAGSGDAQYIPSILEFDTFYFDTIKNNSVGIIGGSSPFSQYCQFNIYSSDIEVENKDAYYRIIDFAIFPRIEFMVALAIDPYGLLLYYYNSSAPNKNHIFDISKPRDCFESHISTY